MKSKRRLLFRLGAVAALVLIAVAMFIVGRGHTLYLDNKTLEHGGQSYPAAYRVQVQSGGTEVAKLGKRERGMQTWIGQNYRMVLDVTQEKGGEVKSYPFQLKLPHGLDGIVLNLPALLAGLPEEVYMSEFVPLVADTAPAEEVTTDEFEITVPEGT